MTKTYEFVVESSFRVTSSDKNCQKTALIMEKCSCDCQLLTTTLCHKKELSK